MMPRLFPLFCLLLLWSCRPASPQTQTSFDLIIRHGTVYDGSGSAPVQTDIGISGDTIAALGDLSEADAPTVLDAEGLAVAPGFINVLSWSVESLLIDGRSQGEIRQGVTTEVFGEGVSWGPLNADMKQRMKTEQGDLTYDVSWTTLSEYLKHLESQGVSPNVASFLGATTVREYVIGLEDKAPTPAQLAQMRQLVRQAMEEGALGIGSSLIYAPATYASTDELIELCKVAAEYGGMYISHLRDEGDSLLPALDELIRISREARIPAEVYHLKAAGERNWPKLDSAIARIEAARQEGLPITADVYVYTASSNGLDSRIPSWAHSGGPDSLYHRLQMPDTRQRLLHEIRSEAPFPRILLVGFKSEALKPLIGQTLEEVAQQRGQDQAETMLDLVLEDRSSVQIVSFIMSEENIKTKLRQPWVALGSDATSRATEGVFLLSSTHPRAYGNFARLLGKYVREENVLPLQEAIRRITSLPAQNLKLTRRGALQPGYFADVVVFDPDSIADRATYDHPHQYAVGMHHVLVNGTPVLQHGEHTGAKPGRALWGPGFGRKSVAAADEDQ
ncbi:N-acyl-D-amino-acid deacylase [Catalinimonas alkaloidigena]|uniref:N-acyl-D-amino-acid deacylase n=1 Tax=Catalinimonas alkaloidigena TaxID=1075417 RepID=A0A1G9HEY2_9BACT|nr:D-aminoacylase [Catalinimonas alkaloidigena]SDL11405.1 N-acyl-D-amino-acid deacylase [Catalinimonas alkaloidigena]